jgi:hypothetical protein
MALDNEQIVRQAHKVMAGWVAAFTPAGRSGAADGQQPQFAASPHRRSPVGGAELGVDPPDVGVNGVQRDR